MCVCECVSVRECVARRLTNRKDLTAAEERISLIMAQRARHVGLVVWSEYGKYSLTGVEYKKKKTKEKRKEIKRNKMITVLSTSAPLNTDKKTLL